MVEDIRSLFKELNKTNYLEFDKIENKFSNRADLHAFIKLDKLIPDRMDIVGGAKHDEIYLSIDLDELGAVATERDVLELVQAGVFYDSSYDTLQMFV